jgi:hypothetical protein
VENKRLYIVIISLILVAVAKQGLQGLNIFSAGNKKPANLELAFVDSQPYYRNSSNDSNALIQRKSNFKLNGLGTSGQTVFNHDDPKAAANAKKAEGKVAVKKKKKKKKKKAKASSEEDSSYEYYATNDNKKSAAPNTNKKPEAQSFLPDANDTDKEDENLKTYEEWARKLLSRPDLKETTKFIQAFQSGLVPEEVFYDLVQKMYEQDRVDFKEQALLAFGSTPSLTSFVQLAEVSNAANSVSNAADNKLRDYESLNLIWVLRSVFVQFNDGPALLAAARSIDNSTARYLTEVPTPTTESARTPSAEETHEKPIFVFASMLPILEARLIQSQSTPGVGTHLQAAIDRIRSALPKLNGPGQASLEPLANSQ